nr:hypothetical protein [Tanacetum cinerariifolium]
MALLSAGKSGQTVGLKRSRGKIWSSNESESPLRDVSQGEACPPDFGFIADKDRATIAKSSTLPHDSAPRVTSHAADEGNMQHTINELTAFCTSLQRQHSEVLAKFQAQEVEINRLKERVKLLEDREGMAAERSGDDALIKWRSLDEEEAAVERTSNDTEEMATVLTSMDAAIVLASRAVEVPTGSGSIPIAGPPAAEVPTGSDVVPIASLVFATASMVTPYRRRKGKEVMVESETPKKQKVQEQIDAQGMTFEEVKEKFNSIWKQIEDFIPMGSKEEAERIKRKDLSLEQESAKKQKASEEVTKEAKSPDEVPEEKVKEMMQLVPIEELYDSCGVHHVTAKDKEIFMLVEKDYTLRKGIEFPLAEEVLTASEEGCHCQKKREATAKKIALLSKSRRNC